MISDFEIHLGNNYQRYWLSPELLLAEPYPYGSEVDIWSFGCIVMEMVEGHPPYSDFRPLKVRFLFHHIGVIFDFPLF
jgi:protein-serine/threonine kinase